MEEDIERIKKEMIESGKSQNEIEELKTHAKVHKYILLYYHSFALCNKTENRCQILWSLDIKQNLLLCTLSTENCYIERYMYMRFENKSTFFHINKVLKMDTYCPNTYTTSNTMLLHPFTHRKQIVHQI